MRDLVLMLVCALFVVGLAGCLGDGGESLEASQVTSNPTNTSSQPLEDVSENATNTTIPEPATNATDTNATTTNATEANKPAGPIEQWESYIEAIRSGDDAKPPRIEDPGQADEHVVVAVIDSGVNPFHETFRTGEVGMPGDLPLQAVDQASDQAPLYVPIQPVDLMDRTEWLTEALEPRTLYSFAGTNLMFYSLDDEVETMDPSGHGTAVAGTVAKVAPKATIVIVQHARNFGEAMTWAAEQPWIDVVSVSIGCSFPIPQTTIRVGQCEGAWLGQRLNGLGQIATASKRGVASGKVWLNSAGNNPTVHLPDELDGPPWVIAVGGADQYRRGETAWASKAPDVLSDYIVEDLPTKDSITDTGWSAGTSFGTPMVSGTLANAILELRERTGYAGTIADGELVPSLDVTNHDLRSAMNHTAMYWGPSDYRATAPGHPAPGVPEWMGTPIAPAMPWAQMGWGYVDASLSDEILKVLIGDDGASKSPDAVAYMQARQQARQAMWS